MTGTSCDALDAACLDIAPGGWEPAWTETRPYPKELRRRVLEIQKPGRPHSVKDWLELHRDLGRWYGATLASICGARRSSAPDCIANHGQTIAHFPATQGRGFTLQAGDPTHIAAATGLTVVSNFREGDIAAGGKGAPLVPKFHRLVAEALGGRGIAIHNIGGVSNLTYVAPDGKITAFDTGPGNLWIDAAAEKATRGRQRMDRGGRLAFAGNVDPAGVRAALALPYFSKRPPKSTGRDDFPFDLLLKKTSARGKDLVSTATWITIESIAQAYERHILGRGLPLRAIFLSGGGALNDALFEGLQARLPDVEIATMAQAGFDPSYLEAQAFAFFGFLSLLGKPIGGDWTGRKGFAPPGHLVPGENWRDLLKKLSAFS